MITALALAGLLALPAQDAEHLLQGLRARLDRAGEPGTAVAVLRGGEVLFAEAFGSADLESGEPMTTATPVYLASLAKTFTAAAAVHAAHAGFLDLDAPLTDVLEELPDAYHAATLRQCLGHRSGLPDVYDAAIMADLGREPLRSNAAALAVVRELAPCFPPGTEVVYSNTGYVAVAEALARAGHPLPEYARAQLFEPLGMDGAAYGPGPRARAYARTAAGWRPEGEPTGLLGPGGLQASLDDLVLFALAWGAGEWGDEELRAELLDAPALAHPRLGRLAAGWMHQRVHGAVVRRHSGGAFGYSSDLLVVPSEELVLVALSCAAGRDAPDLTEELLAGLLGPERAAPVEAAASLGEGVARALAGVWRSGDGRVLVLRPEGGSWIATGLGDLRVTLVPDGPARLAARGTLAPYSLELDSPAAVLRAEQDGRTTSYLRVPPPAADAGEVAGTYESEALGSPLELRATADGRLALVQHDPVLELPPFVAVGADLWLCDRGAALAVERDADGRVAGFVADVNRAWGLRFRRVE